MSLPTSSVEHYQQQQQIDAATAATIRRLWARMGGDFDASWALIRPLAVAILQAGQLAAARASVPYIAAALDEQGLGDGNPAGSIDPAVFASTAPDGRDVGTLLDQAPIIAKAQIGRGATAEAGLAVAGRWLTMTTLSTVADTSREVVAADIAQRTQVQGWVRMLNPPSCNRCVVLAGKWFRWNQGFQRHPRCDCRHVPSAENVAGDFTTDPYAYFRSLSKNDQDSTFGVSEARAIREGGDIYRVVNTSVRGLASPGSRQAIRYGTPTRKTVDQIFRTAGTRTNAIRMMRDEGYITGPQIAGGNILGNAREGFGQFGKGGDARTASNAVLTARRTGVRDPLNRHTMTAAERHLYDAKVRLDAATQRGIWLQSIGANSADKNTRPLPITPARLAILRRNYENELRKARTGPSSVKRLASALGITL